MLCDGLDWCGGTARTSGGVLHSCCCLRHRFHPWIFCCASRAYPPHHAQAMPAVHGPPVPSRCLLHFLRCQLDAQAATHQPKAPRQKVSLSPQCRAFSHSPSRRAAPRPLSDRHSTHERHHVQSRELTTSASRQNFWRKLRPSQPSKPLQHDDIPPLPTYEDHGGLGGRVARANELKLRCTEFDENGNILLVDEEFRKSELIAKVCGQGGVMSARLTEPVLSSTAGSAKDRQ